MMSADRRGSHALPSVLPVNPRSANRAPLDPNLPSVAKSRTSHACDRCRAMRTKCSGGLRCTKCMKDDSVCTFSDRKRERNKKDLVESIDRIRELEGQNKTLVGVLEQMASGIEHSDATHTEVLDILNRYRSPESSDSFEGSQSQPSVLHSSAGQHFSLERSHKSGEQHASSSIGSPGAQGELEWIVDLDHGRGASGYIGKMSEISWMQRAREYLLDHAKLAKFDAPGVYDRHTAAAQDMAYFRDDCDLLSVDEDHIVQLQLPTYPLVPILTEAYFHSTHGAFCFVPRAQFFDLLHQHVPQPSILHWNQRRTLAVANLVWAIGSKWLELASLDQSLAENHLVFYARARALGIDHRVVLDHPDVEMVQGIGLLAFYLLINGSITRARNSLGQALRHATALGLHLKVNDPSIAPEERQNRAKIWYSLYSLEILIAEITGRPASIQSISMTVTVDVAESGHAHTPQPHSYEMQSESLTVWRQFLAAANTPFIDGLDPKAVMNRSDTVPILDRNIQLCQISDQMALRLYSGITHASWADVQDIIESLQTTVEQWDSIPSRPLRPDASVDQGSPAGDTALAMHRESIIMILHRPCLCDIQIEDQSERSREFNLTSARACVRAAVVMIDMIPEDPEPSQIWNLSPWWTLLHYICQATAVLLIELCLECQHFQGESAELLSAVRKAMASLWRISQKSTSADCAARIFHELLNQISQHHGGPGAFGLADIPSFPINWSDADEAWPATITIS